MHETKSMTKLTEGMSKSQAAKLSEKRISVMNHDEKYREKVEITKCDDIIKAVERP